MKSTEKGNPWMSNITDLHPGRTSTRVDGKEPMHELSNILGSILLAAQSHSFDGGLTDDVREDFDAIAARARDGKRIIEALRSTLR